MGGGNSGGGAEEWAYPLQMWVGGSCLGQLHMEVGQMTVCRHLAHRGAGHRGWWVGHGAHPVQQSHVHQYQQEWGSLELLQHGTGSMQVWWFVW